MIQSRLSRRRFLASSAAFGLACATLTLPRRARAATTYTTRGIVKSVGSSKRRVRIHHEDIPRFMKSMTMPFDVASPTLLDGIAPGDHVAFTFEARDDGDLVIVALKKAAVSRGSRI